MNSEVIAAKKRIDWMNPLDLCYGAAKITAVADTGELSTGKGKQKLIRRAFFEMNKEGLCTLAVELRPDQFLNHLPTMAEDERVDGDIKQKSDNE